MSDRVLKLWESYRSEVVPEGAGISQLVETRRAFYAGANALLGLIVNELTPDSEPTEADLAMLDEVAAELRAYGQSVVDGGRGA